MSYFVNQEEQVKCSCDLSRLGWLQTGEPRSRGCRGGWGGGRTRYVAGTASRGRECERDGDVGGSRFKPWSRRSVNEAGRNRAGLG